MEEQQNSVKPVNAGQIFVVVPDGKEEMLNPFEGNEDYGYIVIKSSVESINEMGWLQTSKRSFTIKGEMDNLRNLLKSVKANGYKLPGRIRIIECVESDIPKECERFIRDDVEYEDAIEPFVKRAGEDGEVLTKDGERILRFSMYDPQGDKLDTFIQHENEIEGSSARQAQFDEVDEEENEEVDEDIPTPPPVLKKTTKPTGKAKR